MILLAYRDFETEVNWDDDDSLTSQLTLLAIVGIQVCGFVVACDAVVILAQDPVRDEVPEAVKICTKAGVIVRMVTGDNLVTARAIATNCGIIRPGDGSVVMEGMDY